MHWKDLSLHIAELEKQQEERRQREKDLDRLTVNWPAITGLSSDRETCEDMEDECNTLTSRLQSQMNLQLCFINNSESEEEEEEEMESKKEVAKPSSKRGSNQRLEKVCGSSSALT
ncbi:uncharacterized protein LOC113052068 isoform X2 [Carassius auratus]|uniref:Uncharacterized protein LOC113052068 isoform X2 n=1 Tax=Carassius auratus TaxID=7957 RepID=A0A6P6KKR3_CARAU|nr:uncharacterized protein LOC113052068 isoform X2 [Carassius auratus]